MHISVTYIFALQQKIPDYNIKISNDFVNYFANMRTNTPDDDKKKKTCRRISSGQHRRLAFETNNNKNEKRNKFGMMNAMWPLATGQTYIHTYIYSDRFAHQKILRELNS